ncbi:MAG: flagellar assembly protein FliW [Desulfovibrionaceae bacterium]|nr:flagellar assembly protein FliW [Desulfovibrionaceae bacterium]
MARETEIEIDSRLGRRVIDTQKVLHFPHGLIGLENERDFILLQIRPEAPLLILQSVNNPLVGLLVADPYSFMDRFPISLSEAEKQLLQIGQITDAAVLVTVSIPPGHPQDAMLNLTGPILINHQARIGLQAPQNMDGPAQVRMHALTANKEAQAGKGTA